MLAFAPLPLSSCEKNSFSVCLLLVFLNICFSLICLNAVPSFLTKLTPAPVTAVSAQYALEELRLGRAGVSTQKNVDVSSHLVFPTWRRQRGSHTSNHLENKTILGGPRGPAAPLVRGPPGFLGSPPNRASARALLMSSCP